MTRVSGIRGAQVGASRESGAAVVVGVGGSNWEITEVDEAGVKQNDCVY